MKIIITTFVLYLSVMHGAFAAGEGYATLATISSTIGLTADHVCFSDSRDIGCGGRNVYVDSAGKVGVGTNSPQTELEVIGTISASVVTATTFYGDGSNLTGISSAAKIAMTVSGGNNQKITLANGVALFASDARSVFTPYNNLPSYLLGTEGTDKVNGSNVTITLGGSAICYLIRDNGWIVVPLTGWTLKESGKNYITSNMYVYEKLLSSGTHVLNVQSAMYACNTGGGADNLGNHTATQSLVMGSNDITGAGHIGVTSISTTANVEVSGTIQVSGTGSEICTSASDVGIIRKNPSTGTIQICR